MQRKFILTVLSIVSICTLCFALCFVPSVQSDSVEKVAEEVLDVYLTDVGGQGPITENLIDTKQDSVEVEAPETDGYEYSADYLERRFSSMLNINYCYGAAFKDAERIAVASALTLKDYATDIPGVGLAVNTALVEGFAKSFYGAEAGVLVCDSINTDRVSLYEGTVDTQIHNVVSVEKSDLGYEVFSTVEFYDGGDNAELCFCKSVFVPDSESEFGFNLIFCELM